MINKYVFICFLALISCGSEGENEKVEQVKINCEMVIQIEVEDLNCHFGEYNDFSYTDSSLIKLICIETNEMRLVDQDVSVQIHHCISNINFIGKDDDRVTIGLVYTAYEGVIFVHDGNYYKNDSLLLALLDAEQSD